MVKCIVDKIFVVNIEYYSVDAVNDKHECCEEIS